MTAEEITALRERIEQGRREVAKSKPKPAPKPMPKGKGKGKGC